MFITLFLLSLGMGLCGALSELADDVVRDAQEDAEEEEG